MVGYGERMTVDLSRVRALIRIAEEMGTDIGLPNAEADTAEAFINLANCVPVLVKEVELLNAELDVWTGEVKRLEKEVEQWRSSYLMVMPSD